MSTSCPLHPADSSPSSPNVLCPRCVVEALKGEEAPVPDGSGPCRPGQWVGLFRIERFLGRGATGDVYAAEDVRGGRRVALKILSETLDDDERRRFSEEGELAARVHHPNSVYVFETGQFGHRYFIVMELVDGRTLSQLVAEQGPLPIKSAVDITLQLLDGLAAAHAAGILHRDIKPSNCFLDDERVKIGDYGLSIARNADGDGERGSGTPGFASPEQLRGGVLDVRADIFGVAATLFFLLTGRAPGDSIGLTATAAGGRGAPVSARALRTQIPKALDRTIQKCLNPGPAERPGTCAELRQALVPFGLSGFSPASVERRVGAAAFDGILCMLAGGVILAGLIGLWPGAPAPFAIAVALLLPALIIWVIVEGLFGAAYGKRALGIRVVGPDGGAPGLWRALVRRGTRTVAMRKPDTEEPSPYSVVTDGLATERVGPYRVVKELWAHGEERLLQGVDPVLRRDVWIHQFRRAEEPRSRTERCRSLRPRWLSGQDTAAFSWNAYGAEKGRPLVAVPPVQAWRSVRTWLLDVAGQLQRAAASSDQLSPERVWISSEGRAMLLPFRCPGLPLRLNEVAHEWSGVRLLGEIGRIGLRGVARHELPRGVSGFLNALEGQRFLSVREVTASLAQLGEQPDVASSRQRGIALALSVISYLIAVVWLGRLLEAAMQAAQIGGAFGCFLVAVGSGAALRGGLWLRACGLAVVDRDGRDVSRARASCRAAVAWSCIPVFALAAAAGSRSLVGFVTTVCVLALVDASLNPRRGFHDRLAGTYLVPL
jgi:uncharacterized RDD family membrane protein YckC/predicted Ser/Thr protein kinase